MIPTLLAIAATALQAPGPSREPLAAARLADIDFLESTIRSTHPEPMRKRAREEWAPKIAALREHAGELSDGQFFFELSSLLALLEDGHTRLLPSLDGDASRWYPIRFECFDDGIYVLAADKKYEALVGGRVVALGGRPIAEVLAAAAPAVPGDNPQGARSILQRLLDAPCFHEAVGVGPGGVGTRISVERPGGEHREMALLRPDPGPPPFAGAWPSDWIRAESKPLLRDREPDRPYFLESLEPGHTLYVRIRRIEQDEKEKIVPFCKRMLALADGGAERLVLDLRGNGGGNNYLNQPIVHAVLQSKLDEPGKLFVLVDGGTFSAAQNLASQLERETWALFVGSPTGSSPNHCGDAQRFTLPSSGFRLWCSTVRWQDSDPRDPRRWIYPDFPAPETYADFAEGRDAALELARTCKPEKIEGYDGVLPIAHWQRATQKGVWPPR